MFSALFCSSSRSVLKLSSPEEAVVRGKGIARTSKRKLEKEDADAYLDLSYYNSIDLLFDLQSEKVKVARVSHLYLRSVALPTRSLSSRIISWNASGCVLVRIRGKRPCACTNP